ncbi:Survival motor neuron protein [Dirofilaria immitis]
MWNNLFKIRKNWNNPFSGGFVNDIEVTFDINAVYYCVECEIRMGSDGLNDEDVVYRKADLNDAENEDIWDDSALIRMYDEMINKTYDSLGEQYITTGRRKKKHRKGPRIKWYVGDRCMAPYYDDELWYPAVVREISLREGTCLVLYDVYDEQAWVDIADLIFYRLLNNACRRSHISVCTEKCWHGAIYVVKPMVLMFWKLRAKPSVSPVKYRRCWLSFPRFAGRPSKFGNEQRWPRQYRKRKIKEYCPKWAKFIQMEYGGKKWKKYQQKFAIFSDTAAIQESAASDLTRTVYMMNVMDNLKHQKPIENDDEGTSNGNTTQETIAMKQQEWRINHTQTATDCFNHMQSSSTNQHTSIPSMVPPPPMAFNNLPAPDNDEALASMLMSWYMTGYHTGYYQALQDKKKKEVKNVSNNH